LFVLLAVPALLFSLSCASSDQEGEDPFIWLEDVEGDRAMEWVLEQNDLTRTELQAFPAYQQLFDNTLEILTSTARIAYPGIQGGQLYNFWTDAAHPRGVYRRTTWDSYLSGDPEWETVLDVDALVAEEDTPWAFRGMNCLAPEYRLCLVSLSPGGSDAVEVREFDLRAILGRRQHHPLEPQPERRVRHDIRICSGCISMGAGHALGGCSDHRRGCPNRHGHVCGDPRNRKRADDRRRPPHHDFRDRATLPRG
jgi:hypothetical protein